MSRLEKIKKTPVEKVQKTVRVPKELYMEFDQILARFDMDFNEAINGLIDLEVKEEKKKALKEAKKDAEKDSKKDSVIDASGRRRRAKKRRKKP